MLIMKIKTSGKSHYALSFASFCSGERMFLQHIQANIKEVRGQRKL